MPSDPTGSPAIRLILRNAMPGREAPGDLDVHLEGNSGWAVAPRFNRAIHKVAVDDRRVADGVEVWNLSVLLNPDAWYPASSMQAAFNVELLSGRGDFRGTIGNNAVEGSADLLPSPSPGGGMLHLCCQQFFSEGRVDFRDLRIELPSSQDAVFRGRAVTLQDQWPPEVGIVASSWDGKFLLAELAMNVSMEAGLANPRRIVARVEAERRGRLLRGRWHLPEDGREGDLWGELRVAPAPRHRAFVSPGMIVGAEDISGAKARIAAVGIWGPAWALLQSRADVWRAWEPRPHAKPAFVHWNAPGPVRDLKEDCEAAWGNALLHALADGDGHAEAATRIIRGWAETFSGIADVAGHLSTSYCFPAMVWAADLLRSSGNLEAGVEAEFRRCLGEVVRPIARTELHFNNWSSWANHLDACIAVFCERGDWFDLALDRYRCLLERYTYSPRGITAETGRDLVHAQMGIAPMIATSELAWRQGIDLYAEQNMRLRAAVELHGPFAMGQLDDWPLDAPAKRAGQVWPMYELAVRHYLGRLGLPMPRSCSVIDATRPEGFNRTGWGTLLSPWEGEKAWESIRDA